MIYILQRRKCKGCRFALYCDNECQKRHWRAENKDECKMLRDFDKYYVL